MVLQVAVLIQYIILTAQSQLQSSLPTPWLLHQMKPVCIYMSKSKAFILSVPEPLHSLGDTDIVCLERVEGNTHGDGGDAQSPHGNGTGEGNAVLGEVVNDA